MNNTLSTTSEDESISLPTEWAFEYWRELDTHILRYDKRKPILEVLTSNPVGTLSTTALTDVVVSVLDEEGLLDDQKRYNDQNLNKVLPEFERLGLVYRIPKFEKDDNYVIFPNERVLTWIDSCPIQGYLTPENTPDNWGTAHTGRYITDRIGEIKAGEAGLHVGPKSIIYSSVNEYGTVDSPEIDFEIGSLEVIRDAEFELTPIIEELSLGTSLPDPDGPYVDKDGVHDYAIFGRVSGIIRLVSARQLQRRLKQQLSVWLASAQSHYAQTYGSNDAAPQLSSEQLAKAARAVRDHKPIPAARERFGLDVAVTRPEDTEDDTGSVCFGLYRRTGSDDPQL